MTTPEQQDKIRALAQKIWEEAGRPDGQADAHWEEAERRLATPEPPMQSEATLPGDTRTMSSGNKPGVVKDGETRHAPFDPDHYKPASSDPVSSQRPKPR